MVYSKTKFTLNYINTLYSLYLFLLSKHEKLNMCTWSFNA